MSGDIIIPAPHEIPTERLLLRRWRRSDWDAFAEQGADPHVMRYFVSTRTREQCDEQADHFSQWLEEGMGPWVIEFPDEAEFIGIVGFWRAADFLPMAPGIELGWRLNAPYWGRGLAIEAADAAIDDLFRRTDIENFFAVTATVNLPSRRALQKLGMRYCPDEDFDHDKVPDGSVLKPHVVYRMGRSDRYPEVSL